MLMTAKTAKLSGRAIKVNWNEYKKLALRTESIPNNEFQKVPVAEPFNVLMLDAENRKATRILHAALGLGTEVTELAFHTDRANWLEEAGDCFWYLAILDDVIGFYPQASLGCMWEFPDRGAQYWVGEIQDCTKRWIFYGKELEVERLHNSAYNLAAALIWEMIERGIFYCEVLEANIRKLEKRYPNLRFEPSAAIHRNVDRELEHISQDGTLLPKTDTILELPEHTTEEEAYEIVRRAQTATNTIGLEDMAQRLHEWEAEDKE